MEPHKPSQLLNLQFRSTRCKHRGGTQEFSATPLPQLLSSTWFWHDSYLSHICRLLLYFIYFTFNFLFFFFCILCTFIIYFLLFLFLLYYLFFVYPSCVFCFQFYSHLISFIFSGIPQTVIAMHRSPCSIWQPVRLASGWWLVLVCSERKVLLAGCWWLVCSERKLLLAGGW
jgi:hypothetical protein